MKIRKKIGVVSCSGECCSLGTVSRIATRLILEELRPNDSVTICLPLFLAGEEGERSFAREHPTIAVDGCGRLCAKKGIEKHSGKTAGSVDVEALLKDWGEQPPASRRDIGEKGFNLANRVAGVVAAKMDAIRKEEIDG